MLDSSQLEGALAALGELLEDRRASYELVAIGGGALVIVGLIERATKDLDVVALVEAGALVSAAELPPVLAEAAADVARALDLGNEWLNSGPSRQLDHGLPDGFLARCTRRTFGGLVVWFASRIDQIHLKLHAAVDDRFGGKHYRDLELLRPSADELAAAAAWARTQNRSESFARTLRECVLTLGGGDV